jgi:hypothetical protein
MMLQIPVPPTPPTPQFDPNLIFMEGGPPLVLMIVLAALAATVIILWPIMRAFGRRLEGRGSADPAVKGEIDLLHARLGEVDALRQEVAELHERVDFAERLLMKEHDRNVLGRGEGAG